MATGSGTPSPRLGAVLLNGWRGVPQVGGFLPFDKGARLGRDFRTGPRPANRKPLVAGATSAPGMRWVAVAGVLGLSLLAGCAARGELGSNPTCDHSQPSDGQDVFWGTVLTSHKYGHYGVPGATVLTRTYLQYYEGDPPSGASVYSQGQATTDDRGCFEIRLAAPPSMPAFTWVTISAQGYEAGGSYQMRISEAPAEFRDTHFLVANPFPWSTVIGWAVFLAVVGGLVVFGVYGKAYWQPMLQSNRETTTTAPPENPSRQAPTYQVEARAAQPGPQVIVQRSSAGKIAFWVVFVAILVLIAWYWLHLQNDCIKPSQFGNNDGEDWEFWKYRCP